MDVPIVTEPNPILREVAKEVPKSMFGSTELADIVYRMSKALRGAPHGVAIAAPQIGISLRIFLVRGFVMQNHERNDVDLDVVFINPVLVNHSRGTIPVAGEGCLSVPDVYGTIERHEKATVEAYDVTGKKFQRGGSDLIAEIFQHEIDHLNGILFIDRASDLKQATPEDPV